MLTNGKHPRDPYLEEILSVLSRYREDHPKAQIDARRQYAFAVFVRIIDPDFKAMDPGDRLDLFHSYLEPLSLLGWNHLGHVILLTPAEAKKDLVNRDFEDLMKSKKIVRPGIFKSPPTEEPPPKKGRKQVAKTGRAH